MLKIIATLGLTSLLTSVFAADAATLVKTKCAVCHGAKMEKSAMGKSAIANTLSEADIKKDLTEYKAGTLNRHGMGAVMAGQAKTLTPADIDALSKYIPTLK